MKNIVPLKTNIELKLRVYDTDKKKKLNKDEIATILKEIIEIKNTEIEIKGTKKYYVSQFLNCKDIKEKEIYEGNILILRFIDKRTKEKDEKLELGITIIDEETLIPMVETIENRLYNLNYYLKEKELEILSIGNIVEDTELFKSLLKANELQIEINTKKFNSKKKDRTIKNEIKKMEEELDRIKTNIFKKYNF